MTFVNVSCFRGRYLNFSFFNKSRLLVAMFVTGHIRLKRFCYFVEGELVLLFSNSDHYFKEDVLRILYR